MIGEYDASGVEIKTYGYKPGSTWTTDPLFMKVGTQYYFYHNDHLGTPQKMTATNGAVVWSAKYESFGKAVVEVETVENNLRFPGQYYDSESGLHYNWNRYYNTQTGRYLTPDSMWMAKKKNLYLYVQNNPKTMIDPWGLLDWPSSVDDFERRVLYVDPHGPPAPGEAQCYKDCVDDAKEAKKNCDTFSTAVCESVARKFGSRYGVVCSAVINEVCDQRYRNQLNECNTTNYE